MLYILISCKIRETPLFLKTDLKQESEPLESVRPAMAICGHGIGGGVVQVTTMRFLQMPYRWVTIVQTLNCVKYVFGISGIKPVCINKVASM
jgi:hypothetical protein